MRKNIAVLVQKIKVKVWLTYCFQVLLVGKRKPAAGGHFLIEQILPSGTHNFPLIREFTRDRHRSPPLLLLDPLLIMPNAHIIENRRHRSAYLSSDIHASRSWLTTKKRKKRTFLCISWFQSRAPPVNSVGRNMVGCMKASTATPPAAAAAAAAMYVANLCCRMQKKEPPGPLAPSPSLAGACGRVGR